MFCGYHKGAKATNNVGVMFCGDHRGAKATNNVGVIICFAVITE